MRYLFLIEVDCIFMLEVVGVIFVFELFGDVFEDVCLGKYLDLLNYRGELEVECYLVVFVE